MYTCLMMHMACNRVHILAGFHYSNTAFSTISANAQLHRSGMGPRRVAQVISCISEATSGFCAEGDPLLRGF